MPQERNYDHCNCKTVEEPEPPGVVWMVRPGTGQSQAPLDCLGPELMVRLHGRIQLVLAAMIVPQIS